RRTGEAFPPEAAEMRQETLACDRFFPALRLDGYGAADARQGLGLRHPQTAADENVSGRQMNVESRCVHVACEAVAELARGMFLIRTFIAREPHVAVNAEHGTAIRPRIGNELLGDLPELRRHGHDEVRHLSLDRAAKSLLIGFEPGALVVLLEAAEEGEERLGESAELSHGNL